MSDDVFPDHVERFDGAEIVAWQDVPEKFQKKILEGTITNEDWNSDWESPPVAKHTQHIWRKEYSTCMIKGCGAVKHG